VIKREERMKKGETKKIYTYTDRDIARVAGVSIGAVRVAKVRRKILANDLRSVSVYIIEHWLKTMQRKSER
jgi:adenine-specific DNA methylase